MISCSYSIVDPWTVVIESFNTFIADIAVSTSRGPNDMAFRSKASGFISFNKSDKINFITFP